MNRLILLLFLFSISVKSQKTINGLDNVLSKTRIMMNQKKITDYIILTKSHYSQVITIYENTNKEEINLVNDFNAFIFWHEGSRCFVKLVDKDFEYQDLEIDNCEFIKLDSKTIAQISKEKVFPVIEKQDGRKVYVEISNDYDSKFYFYNGSSEEFPDFYLYDLNRKNLNYNLNHKLHIYKLYLACQKILDSNFKEIHIK